MGLLRTDLVKKGGAQAHRPHLFPQPSVARFRALASLMALAALWGLISAVLDDPLRAPGPQQVLPALWDGLLSGRMLPDLLATLRRVGLAFLIAMGVGTAGGIILGLSPRLDRWLDPWLTVLNILGVSEDPNFDGLTTKYAAIHVRS